MTSNEIRQRFLDFFSARGHKVVPSSPLVPANDPSLLFTNAGMVQFKDVFLGSEQRSYRRAASAQACVRAGGKHNDLENVGYTARHHTFFEMLGNFSFGDYFKPEAIEYAWAFLTEDVKLPPERLWVTVFEEDDEAADAWLKDIGVDRNRFARIGTRDNFWAMGDTGPCGPCSEIFYDHGPQVAGGPPGTPEQEGDRFVEVWNLVFMQYDRDQQGKMTPLPAPCVDTGMGLERLAAILQGVHSNYDIDLFQGLIRAAAETLGAQDLANNSLKVIADHIRACAFLIADGVVPSNEGRGYVLRRIIRRALRHGHQLGAKEPFFYRLVAPLDAEMGAAYPILSRRRGQVEKLLRQEEERFNETLDQGLKLLESAIAQLDGAVLPGETVFKLYDTYGFPVDLTADIARERGLSLDQEGFDEAMGEQRARARAASRFQRSHTGGAELAGETAFTGYERLTDQGKVMGLYRDGDPVDALERGDTGLVVLDNTPFYAEGGGQVGDRGVLATEDAEFAVEDTQKSGAAAYAHIGTLKSGQLRVGETVTAKVDAKRRQATVLNHSATHLLHAALRQVLGEHVTQKGSLVAPDRLRFDFSHYEPVSAAKLQAIEDLVNGQIRANLPAEVVVLPYDKAIAQGALAFFGEKYGDKVRVLKIGDFSTELCGGTHVKRTGDIGYFKITLETGIAAGIRRIEALTGRGAQAWVNETDRNLREIAGLVKTDRDDAVGRVSQLLKRQRQMERELGQLRARLAGGQGTDLSAQAVDVGGIQVLAARLDGADPKALREAVDRLKSKLKSAAIVLAAVDGDKVRLVAGVTKDQSGRIPAGELVNAVAEKLGGHGGGRPDLAQAGGSNVEALPEALAQVPDWVKARIG